MATKKLGRQARNPPRYNNRAWCHVKVSNHPPPRYKQKKVAQQIREQQEQALVVVVVLCNNNPPTTSSGSTAADAPQFKRRTNASDFDGTRVFLLPAVDVLTLQKRRRAHFLYLYLYTNSINITTEEHTR